MAKGKSSNPADAYRKALRKKELKKNKTDRQKKREFALVKKDTGEIEEEIAELQAIPEPSAVQKSRLNELRSELERINKKKEEYVEAHPESRKLVYAAARRREQKKMEEETELKRGQPDKKDDGSEDDDIVMPDGPPPGIERTGEMDVVSDDEIFLPEDLSEQEPEADFVPPLPPGPPPPTIPASAYVVPPLPLIPIPSVHHITGVTMGSHQILPGTQSLYSTVPHSSGSLPQTYLPAHSTFTSGPVAPSPAPPGFFPRRTRPSLASVQQDPLSPISLPDFSRKDTRYAGRSDPSRNSSLSNTESKTASVDATVSAEPQLRDFKKESTSFVPSALKRKKAGVASTSQINTAPELASDSGIGQNEEATAPKPDLVGTLRGKFGEPPSKSAEAIHREVAKHQKGNVTNQHDDYDKFLTEMGDILDHPQ